MAITIDWCAGRGQRQGDTCPAPRAPKEVNWIVKYTHPLHSRDFQLLSFDCPGSSPDFIFCFFGRSPTTS